MFTMNKKIDKSQTFERRFSISSETSVEQESDSDGFFLESSEKESQSEYDCNSIQSNYDFMRSTENITFSFPCESIAKSKRGSDITIDDLETKSSEEDRNKRNNIDLSFETLELESVIDKELQKVVTPRVRASSSSSVVEDGARVFKAYAFNSKEKQCFFNIGAVNEPVLSEVKETGFSDSSLPGLITKLDLDENPVEMDKKDGAVVEQENELDRSNTEYWKNYLFDKVNASQEVTHSSKNLEREHVEPCLSSNRSSILSKPESDLEITFATKSVIDEVALLEDKVKSLYIQEQFNDIVLLHITLGDSLLQFVEVKQSYLYTGQLSPSLDKDDEILLSFTKAARLHEKIHALIHSSDITSKSLVALHHAIKSLKKLETHCSTFHLYTAILLLLKLAYSKNSESTNLNEKLRNNTLLYLKNWIKGFPKDPTVLLISLRYTQSTVLKNVELLYTVLSSLVTKGYYEVVHFVLNILNQQFIESILLQVLISSSYQQLSLDDVRMRTLNLHDFLIGTGIAIEGKTPNETNFNECKAFVERVACTLKDIQSMGKQLSLVLTKKKQAKQLFVNGKKTAAMELYTEILQHECFKSKTFYPLEAVLLNNRAACYIALCKFEKALEDCDSAIEKDANNGKARVRKARVLMKQCNFDESLKELKSILKDQCSSDANIMNEIRNVVLQKELYRQRQQQVKDDIKESWPSADVTHRALSADEIVMCDDYYAIFQTSRTARIKDIKKSYHKLALKFHPDKALSDKDRYKYEEAFKKIASCFETLKDENKRRLYDAKHFKSLSSSSLHSFNRRYQTYSRYSKGSRWNNYTKQYSYS